MKNRSIFSPSSTDTTWRDEKFDYFRTSDGNFVRVRRDFEREADEAKAKILRARVTFLNWMALWMVRLFYAGGILALAVMIFLKLNGGS